MATIAARKKNSYLSILATIAILAIFAQPCFSATEQLIDTIQLGSYRTEKGANKHFEAVLKKNLHVDLGSLRIEKVGKYYALRLGVFALAEPAGQSFFRNIKARIPGAIRLTVNLRNSRFIRIVDSTTVEAFLSPPAETAAVPVESIPEAKVFLPLPEPKLPAEVRSTLVTKPRPVILKPQNIRARDVVTVEKAEPLIPDGLLIGLVTIISLFMLEHYLRTLARLGTFGSLKWLFAGSAAAESMTEKMPVALPEVEDELQVVFASGPVTPGDGFISSESDLAGNASEEPGTAVVKAESDRFYPATATADPAASLTDVWFAKDGVFDLERGRIYSADELLPVAEEVTEMKSEDPENKNLHTVVPRTSPGKRQLGRTADSKGSSSETGERENRVGRAVLAVSFFAED